MNLTELTQLNETAIQNHYDKYWKGGQENARFRRGQNWSDTEIEAHTKQNRNAYSLAIAGSKINGLLSQQMQTPYDIIAIGRTPEDEINAEIKTAIFKYISEVNDMQYLVSDWYSDAISKKYGVVKRYIDRSVNPLGEIKIKKLLFDYFVWDDNCKDFNMAKNADWCQEFGFSTRESLKAEYPDKAKLIDDLPQNTQASQGTGVTQYKDWGWLDKGRQFVKWVNHEQRNKRKTWKLTFNDGHTEESEKFVRIGEVPEDSRRWVQDVQLGLIYPVSVLESSKDYITCTVFTKDILEPLKEYEKNSSLLSYHNAYSMFDDGEIFCVMDFLKHPQRFLDRLTSQIDASIGKLIKNSYEVKWNLLHENDQERWKKLSAELTAGGAVVRNMATDNVPLVTPINSGTTPPELYNVWQMVMTVLEEMTGGRPVYGLPDRGNSQQSGKYVEALQNAGFAMAYLYVNSLNRSIKSLAEGLNEDINEVYGDNMERIVEITDSDLDPYVLEKFQNTGIYTPAQFRKGRGYLKFKADLGEANTRIILTKGEYSPTAKQQKLWQWEAINKSKIESGQPPYPVTLYAEELGISATIRAKMEEFDKKQEQRQAIADEMAVKEKKFEGNIKMMQEIRAADEQLTRQTGEENGKE